MSKRAAIYARVSTDDQRGNYSIPTQLAACLQFTQAKGYAVVGNLHVDPDTGFDSPHGNGAVPAYVDDYSSRELSRPGLNAALEYLETVGFDVLIVHALDRLARDPYIRQTLELEFSKRSCKVEYVLGNYDESAEGEVRKDLDATFAKWENAKRVERSTRGKLGKAQRGLFVSGCPPFGYRIDPHATGGLAIEEEEAAIVQRIFTLYAVDGVSIRGIAAQLTDEGTRTRSGSTHWAMSTVAKILANPTYVGRCFYNKLNTTGKRLLKRDAAQWIQIDTLPIIDDEVFAEAQRRLARNRDLRRRKTKRFYLLTGMLFCAECEKPYVAQTKRAGSSGLKIDKAFYRHRIKQGHCINRMLSGNRIESIVWSKILEFLLQPASLQKGYNESLTQQEVLKARGKIQLVELRKSAEKIEQKRHNLNAAYIDPEIGMRKTDYLAQKAQLDNELNTTLSKIAVIEQELSQLHPVMERKELESFSAQVRAAFQAREVTPEEKRSILEQLHTRVLMSTDGRIRLDGWVKTGWLSSTAC